MPEYLPPLPTPLRILKGLTRAGEARLCSTRYGPFGHGLFGLGLNVMFLSTGYFYGVPRLRKRTQTHVVTR